VASKNGNHFSTGAPFNCQCELVIPFSYTLLSIFKEKLKNCLKAVIQKRYVSIIAVKSVSPTNLNLSVSSN
jgi:hypothetical protein